MSQRPTEVTTLHTRMLKWIALRALYSQTAALYIGEENLRYFRNYGMPDERMCPLVAADVRSDSAGRQVPWIEGQLIGDFAFRER